MRDKKKNNILNDLKQKFKLDSILFNFQIHFQILISFNVLLYEKIKRWIFSAFFCLVKIIFNFNFEYR